VVGGTGEKASALGAARQVAPKFPSATPKMRGLSDEQRRAMVFTWKEIHNIPATANRCKVKKTTVAQWLQRYKAIGGVTSSKCTVRKHALDDAGNAKTLAMPLGKEHGHAAADAQQLFNQGITATNIAKANVIRAARRAAFAEGKPIMDFKGKPQKRLTEASKAKCLAFAKAKAKEGLEHYHVYIHVII